MQEANLQRLLQRFVSYANAVLRASYQTFDAKLSILIGFCESDAEMSQVTAQLKGNLNLNMEQWLEDFWNSGGSIIG